MQEERVLNQVVGSIMLYDSVVKSWKIAGDSLGLSTVRILYNPAQNIFRIHGQKINQLREVVLDYQITREIKYNRAQNDAFIQWHDSRGTIWGINFRQGSPDALSFFNSVVQVLAILNGHAALPESNGPLQLPGQPNQQQPPQQSNQAPVITQGPSVVQQPMRQQAPQQQQQPMLHQQQQQQQQQLLAQQQQNRNQLLSHVPPTQLAQQQQQAAQPQQQQMHHYMPQAPPTQSQQPNMNQINHYQPQQTNNIIQPSPQQQPQQQQQQQQQHPSQQHMQQQMQLQQVQQPASVSAAPVPPPPPPPPPPAPPMAVLNNSRINGTGSSANTTTNNNSPNNLQHSPVANNSFGLENGANRNGGSPSQAVSLACELAKCQLRKVNRSDSDKESECNNNSIVAAKTTRAASLANCQTFASDNLINDLKGKLASRRERIDQQGDSPASLNSGSTINNMNGIGVDKSHDSWLAEIIRKEISQQLTQMKSEIIDAIKTELRQR